MKIVAEKRAKTGTSASKQARAAGKLPAVIYGKAVDSLPVLIDLKEFEDAIRQVGSNGVFSLEVDDETYQVFVKEYSYYATKPTLYHVDLQAFTAGEKVDMTIPVYVEGEEEILEGILSQSISEIDIVIAPEDAPTDFTIDASKLQIGDSLTVADIELPESAELLTEPDETVVSVSAPEDISDDLETEDTATDVMPEPEVIGEDDEDE
ncbi:MAG TPA: 50S ribosomal protein L25 [Candidatus Atopostipes pullistercoris]|uniref:Large ribosomal subunit protein bL25 n=1 Tax=Candidatus Atopostipes pullistercoris TaxID=2838467 RepID=A0A9D2G099_9LACT|nr:50S ribosomal protein L25 [Candidatus Atopostipes pullistercoris]